MLVPYIRALVGCCPAKVQHQVLTHHRDTYLAAVSTRNTQHTKHNTHADDKYPRYGLGGPTSGQGAAAAGAPAGYGERGY